MARVSSLLKKVSSTLVLTFSFYVSSLAQEEFIERTSSFNEQWLQTLVSIEAIQPDRNLKPIGTGFLIGTPHNHLALVTAKHVVFEDNGKGELRSNLAYRLNNTNQTSSVYADSTVTRLTDSSWFKLDDHDVACRIIVRSNSTEFKKIPYDLLVPDESVDVGAPLLIIGFPLGLRSSEYSVPILRRGIVSRIEDNSYLIDGFIFPGNSGGPVVYSPVVRFGETIKSSIRQQDGVIGIVTSQINYQERAISERTGNPRVVFVENTGLSIVLPAKFILELLNTEEFKKTDESFSLESNSQ